MKASALPQNAATRQHTPSRGLASYALCVLSFRSRPYRSGSRGALPRAFTARHVIHNDVLYSERSPYLSA
jgi:hypothetical protein